MHFQSSISWWLYAPESYRTMDNTYIKLYTQNRGNSNVSRLLLLLFLTGLQPVLSTNGKTPELAANNEEPGLDLTITGPDYVTVGVPSSVECTSSCNACTYSMSLDGQIAQGQGNMLAFTINSWVETLTVTCTLTDDNSQATATTTKQIQVLAGPSNVSISGPSSMNPGVSHTYSCQAYCRPSCTYSWSKDKIHWVKGQGNVISINPTEDDSSKMLICKAFNTVSGLFAAATHDIAVTSGPSEIQIKGPDVIDIAKAYKFECTSKCLPSCRYLSSVDSQTVRGSVIEIEVDQALKSVTLKCEAQNTASKKTATALKTVKMKDQNPSTRPEATSLLLLLAFIISAVVTL